MAGDFLNVMLKAKEQRDTRYPRVSMSVIGKENRTIASSTLGMCPGLRRGHVATVHFTICGGRVFEISSEPVFLKRSRCGLWPQNPLCFDRYNITSEEDLRQAAQRLAEYLEAKTVTVTVTAGIVVNKLNPEKPSELVDLWRRGRDLNSRSPCEDSGFQDRHVRPLRHPSVRSSFS
jgi:hypothetical protein